MIKYYYGISVKHFIYQGKTSGQKPSRQHLASSTYLRAKIRGHQPMENGLVGEIRTRMIVVAVRHITFLSPRGIVVAAWSSSYI